jgi:hypothetical protein
VSNLKRIRHCGRYANGEVVDLAVKDGNAYWLGLQTCGSIWACPVCSAKIRQRRAVEIESACFQHLTEGKSIGFLTLTMPHYSRDDLSQLLDDLMKSWSDTYTGSPYRLRKIRLELTGWIRSTEVTYGSWHGWHPHLHVLLFADRAVTEAEWAELRDAVSDSWAAAVVKNGRGKPGDEVGVTLAQVATAQVGQYLAKVQDHYGNESSIGREMARGDVKKGRKMSRTPFELCEDAIQGVAHELGLWHSYERATKGRRAIEWSRGLKARFDLTEVTDEDLATADVDGTVLVRGISRDDFRLVVKDGADSHLLDLAEEGGAPAVHEFLLRLRNAYTDEDD